MSVVPTRNPLAPTRWCQVCCSFERFDGPPIGWVKISLPPPMRLEDTQDAR